MIAMNTYPASSVVPIFFATYAGATGASITLTGLAVTDIEIYKGTSMTQRSSDAGYALIDTDGIDLDGITGIHGVSIDLGDNTDAGFYAAGSFYTVVVSAVTVDGQTVNFIADRFRIVLAETVAGEPKVDVGAWLGTAVSTPTVAGVPNVNAKTWNDLTTVALPLVPVTPGRMLVVDVVGLADANVVKLGPSGSGTAQTARDVGLAIDASITSRAAASVLGAAVGASISADIAAVKVDTAAVKAKTDNLPTDPADASDVAALIAAVQADTDNIQTRLPAALVGGRMDSSVGAVAAAAITAASIATDAIDADALATDAVTEIVNGVLAGTITELSAIPAASPSLKQALALLFMALRNQVTVTATAKTISNDAGTVVGTKVLSDSGVTYTEAEMA